ncbi:MAG: adenylate/guanylate cyclase domain-containing protein [bacterium]
MDDKKNIEYLESCITGFKRYLPKRIVEKILTNPYNVRVESERRFVTILFGDISGFTALSERLDPEDVIKVINKYFTKMCRIVDKYGGDIDKFIGDAVLVVFGAPVAHEDDPERAIRAALEMQKAMATIEPVYAKGEYVKVTMHIGINTGEVVALNMGVDDRMEYTVMGDNVNLTSRLEGVAQSGEIVIPDRTYKYVKDIFDFDVLEPVMVKGKKEPIPIYRVKGVRDSVKSEDSYSFIGSSQLKDRPVELINEFLGHEQFSYAVTGESGTGKTKYFQYIIDKADRKNISIYEITGKSFFSSTPLMPLKEFVASLLKFSIDASKEEIKEKINNSMLEDDREGLYLLFNLDENQWDENEFIRRVSYSLESLISGRCAKGKHLIVISDLHFFDSLSEILVKRVYDRIRSNKNISFLLSSRNRIDFKYIELASLEQFDIQMTETLVCDRLSGKTAGKDLVNAVYEKSGGNPYYIVELLALLISKGGIEEKDGAVCLAGRSLSIVPDSLKSVFLEQLDKLDEKEKLFLQYSSLLGQEFRKIDTAELLKFNAKEADDYIKSLTLKGYISFIDAERYSFSSALFFEAVYNSLTKDKRTALHDAIGLYLESRHAEPNENLIRTIARHFELSGNIHKAPLYLEKAALFDRKYFSYRQAVEKYEKAFEFYEAARNTKAAAETTLRIAGIYLAVGNAKSGIESLDSRRDILLTDRDTEAQYYFFRGILLDKSGDAANAEVEYDKAIALAEADSNKQLIAKIFNSYGIMKSAAGDYANALNYFNKALDLSIKLNNLNDIASQYINMGKIYGITNEFENALKYYELALDIQSSRKDKRGMVLTLVNAGTIYDSLGNQQKAEECYTKALTNAIETSDDIEKARILNNLANIKFMSSRFDEALKDYKESALAYESLEDKRGMAEVYANMAEIDVMFGEFLAAKPLFEKVLKLCEETSHHHLKLYAEINYANNLSFLGYLEEAENLLLSVIEDSKRMGIPDFTALAGNILAKVNGLSADLESENSILQDSLKLAKEIKNPDIEFSIKSTIVKTYIQMNKLEDAEKTAKEIFDFASSTNNEMLLSDAMASLADIYQKKNDQEKLSEIASVSFDLAEKSKSKLSLVRNIIVLSRFYLLMSDTTSCEEILKKGEEAARQMGSLEHIIIINRISDALYEKTSNVRMRHNSLMKCVNAIEEYVERAGKKNYMNLIMKRGFINFYTHYINVMIELHDEKIIREQLKNYNRRTIEMTLKSMLEKNIISDKTYSELI